MSLPQIDVPVYHETLPISGKKVKYRCYLVKEQKILLIASETKTQQAVYEAICQILRNCTFGGVDPEELPILDVQYLFLRLRCKSVGETSEFMYPCSGCNTANRVTVNLDEVKVVKNPDHKDTIMLTDKIGIKMKYPTIALDKVVRETPSSDKPGKWKESVVLKTMIECIFEKDGAVYPMSETSDEEFDKFMETLSVSQYEQIQTFFQTLPKMEHKLNFTCIKCQANNALEVDSFEDFFE
jgi:hypothetical protein